MKGAKLRSPSGCKNVIVLTIIAALLVSTVPMPQSSSWQPADDDVPCQQGLEDTWQCQEWLRDKMTGAKLRSTTGCKDVIFLTIIAALLISTGRWKARKLVFLARARASRKERLRYIPDAIHAIDFVASAPTSIDDMDTTSAGTSDIEYNPKWTPQNIPASVSVIKLTEIGITLTANETTELIDMHMRLNQNIIFAELSLPPLSLDRDRASYIVNMAALELCTLRVRGLLVGGGGLTNREVLKFFTSFQGLRSGQFYNYVMEQIEIYRENKRTQNKLYSFIRQNRKTIGAVVTGIASVGGIIGTLLRWRHILRSSEIRA
ncbi:hypothetical protein HU200_066225 [Digitaria exilis]|uniref:Uncharacterized protein n=1 Tax=Digitaria exilis TaxID=1010633 RepID=A0A834ZYJ3_9POAL|nr:hypothetical protein HU200_066225 [Digitaria exilis]